MGHLIENLFLPFWRTWKVAKIALLNPCMKFEILFGQKYTAFKTDILKVVLVFSDFKFFNNKNWVRFSYSNWALVKIERGVEKTKIRHYGTERVNKNLTFCNSKTTIPFNFCAFFQTSWVRSTLLLISKTNKQKYIYIGQT